MAAINQADLALEGGGVKGVALVGAIGELAAAGYSFPRVAGSSAGAIVGTFVAALQAAGEPLSRLEDIVRSLDFRRFPDNHLLVRLTGPIGQAAQLLFEDGLYEGNYLHQWLRSSLRDLGVSTFGDLRLAPDPGGDLPLGHRYRLVVTATDLSRRRLALLPWDYPRYGLDPDEQDVADAVRASAGIPFFFEPTILRTGGRGAVTLVDGGVLADFPIGVFDRTDHLEPRWPTFGVRLLPRPDPRSPSQPVRGPLSLLLAVAGTVIDAGGGPELDDPCARRRTIYADTSDVSAIDFDITPTQVNELIAAGTAAARRFLAGWDFAAYVRACRRGFVE